MLEVKSGAGGGGILEKGSEQKNGNQPHHSSWFQSSQY